LMMVPAAGQGSSCGTLAKCHSGHTCSSCVTLAKGTPAHTAANNHLRLFLVTRKSSLT
jgi:hypothetical protein